MSNFSEDFLASELRVAKLRVACEGRAESIERNRSEGHTFIANMLSKSQEKDLAELNTARREHFELLVREAEAKTMQAFREAYDLWVNLIPPYNDMDVYPTPEAVMHAIAAEDAK